MPALIRRSVGRSEAPASPPTPARAGYAPGADGTSLYVEEHGDVDAPLTVVLTHGWTLDRRSWDRQCAGVPARLGAPVRVVTYDHRGHGRSEATSLEDATLEQLGDDLAAVLNDRVQSGPVVLAGHSMGGMTIMALAERHPELFARRVAGVALVSTSCGGLAGVTYGLPSSLAPWVRRAEEAAGHRMLARDRSHREAAGGSTTATDPVRDRVRRAAGAAGERAQATALRPGLRWLLFGATPARSDLDRVVTAVAATPANSVVGFRDAMGSHERRAALAACHGLPVVVACGTRDRLCAPPHSRTLAQAIPGSQLVLYPGTGHMLPMERADEISGHIAAVARSARTV